MEVEERWENKAMMAGGEEKKLIVEQRNILPQGCFDNKTNIKKGICGRQTNKSRVQWVGHTKA